MSRMLLASISRACHFVALPSLRPAAREAGRLPFFPLPPAFQSAPRTCTCAAGGSAASVKLKYSLRPLGKDDVDFAFARSSGAGGQNVNKVNTKVDMRFDLDKQDWIPDEVKDEIRRTEKNRFTKDGVLVVQSQKHRTQVQNIDDALAKVQEIIDAAVVAVTPKEVDPATIKRVKQNIKAGQERRLQNKKKDSMKKKERGRRDWD